MKPLIIIIIITLFMILLPSKNPSAIAHVITTPPKDIQFLHKDEIYDGSRKGLGGRKMLQQSEKKQLSFKEKQKSGGKARKGMNDEATIWAGKSAGRPSSSTMPVFHSHQENAKKEDSEAFLEVVSLMNKDYKGTDRPRHKPPINNHKPTD